MRRGEACSGDEDQGQAGRGAQPTPSTLIAHRHPWSRLHPQVGSHSPAHLLSTLVVPPIVLGRRSSRSVGTRAPAEAGPVGEVASECSGVLDITPYTPLTLQTRFSPCSRADTDPRCGRGEPFSIGSKNPFPAMGCMKESRSSCPSYSDSNATRRMCMCVPRGTDTQSQLGSPTARSALDCPQRQHARRPQGLAPLARTPTIFSCLIQSPGTQAKQGGFDNESDSVCKSSHITSCASRGAVCCCSFRFSLGFSLVVF